MCSDSEVITIFEITVFELRAGTDAVIEVRRCRVSELAESHLIRRNQQAPVSIGGNSSAW